MTIDKAKRNELEKHFIFHQKEHEILTLALLDKFSNAFEFKLKVQKASIQLLNPQPFAVLGFRRSEKHIFIEFYTQTEIKNNRIVKTLKSENNLIINRVEIFTENDIDEELINWMKESSRIKLL